MNLEQLIKKNKIILSKYNFDKSKFQELQGRFQKGELSCKENIEKRKIAPPPSSAIQKIAGLENKILREIGISALKRGEFGYLIMNGGMATRFGAEVKGLVPIFNDNTFLSLKLSALFKVERSFDCKIPIYIMNSFQTEELTASYIIKNLSHNKKSSINFFNQSISLRLDELGNIYTDESGEPSFYAPGHGDLISSFKRSGLLDTFINERGKYIMVSNVDNILATVDPAILGYHISRAKPMTTEVAPLLDGDRGGAPVLISKKVQLLEGFRFPPNFDFKTLKVFNTNTFIFSVEAFQNKHNLTWFAVEKEINKSRVIQFETLIGELSSIIESNYLEIERSGLESRFIPIKTKEDLNENKDRLKEIISGRL